MSTALYNRYRPATFSQVVGQEHVTDALAHALRSGRLHHAYLFSGPRGCGKTSSARILAASLNCELGPTPEPCGVCDQCVSIRNGSSMDVTEIDAASHGLVDDARDLRERAFFAPASARFKVFVVDEAHMVTAAAFNALLKVVEEPPPYLKFIFATTEPDKVIATIRSRTHHYAFRLVPPAVLRDHLASVCEQEGVTVDPMVLPLVVRAGAGSVRDSLSVLDQLLAGAGPGGLRYERAVALLGMTDGVLLDETVDALADRDGAALFTVVDKVVSSGHDPRRFATDLLDRMRDLIMLAAVPDAVERGLLESLSADQLDRMRTQSGRIGPAELSRTADVLHAGLTEMRGTASPRLLLELVLARALLPGAAGADPTALLVRLERLERLDRGRPSAAAVEGVAAGAVAGDAGGVGGMGGMRNGARRVDEAADPRVATTPAAATRRPTATGAEHPPRPPAPPTPGASAADAAGPSGRAAAGPRSPAPAPAGPTPPAPMPASMPASMRASGPGSTPVPGPGRATPGGSVPAGPAATPGGPSARPPMPEPASASSAAPGSGGGGGSGGGADAVRAVWDQVLLGARRRKQTTFALLAEYASVADVRADEVILAFSAPPIAQMFGKGSHGEVLCEALAEQLGGAWRVTVGGAGGPVATRARQGGPGGAGADGRSPAGPVTAAGGPGRPGASSPAGDPRQRAGSSQAFGGGGAAATGGGPPGAMPAGTMPGGTMPGGAMPGGVTSSAVMPAGTGAGAGGYGSAGGGAGGFGGGGSGTAGDAGRGGGAVATALRPDQTAGTALGSAGPGGGRANPAMAGRGGPAVGALSPDPTGGTPGAGGPNAASALAVAGRGPGGPATSATTPGARYGNGGHAGPGAATTAGIVTPTSGPSGGTSGYPSGGASGSIAGVPTGATRGAVDEPSLDDDDAPAHPGAELTGEAAAMELLRSGLGARVIDQRTGD